MMIAFVSPPCSSPSTPHTHPSPHCLFVFSSLIYLHKAQPLSSSPSHLIPLFPTPPFFFLSPHSLYLSSLYSHTENCQGTAHQSETCIQMAGFVKTNLRQTFALYKKKPQLDQQHLSDIFWASGCANNKIGVVCVCVEHFTTLPPFCVVMVHAKIPTGYSCPVGRQGTEYLLVKWSCQLTKSKFGLFQFRPVYKVDQ